MDYWRLKEKSSEVLLICLPVDELILINFYGWVKFNGMKHIVNSTILYRKSEANDGHYMNSNYCSDVMYYTNIS